MNGSDLPRRFPLISLEASELQEEEREQDTVVPGKPILEVRDLVTRFPLRSGVLNRVKREVHAVENVSFDLWPGETLALVGESGCGNPPPGARCSVWWNHRKAALPLTASALIPFRTASCRRCGGIFSLFSRTRMLPRSAPYGGVFDHGAAAGT